MFSSHRINVYFYIYDIILTLLVIVVHVDYYHCGVRYQLSSHCLNDTTSYVDQYFILGRVRFPHGTSLAFFAVLCIICDCSEMFQYFILIGPNDVTASHKSPNVFDGVYLACSLAFKSSFGFRSSASILTSLGQSKPLHFQV